MKRSFILLLFVILFSSCVSKKYGRYFNSQPPQSSTPSKDNPIANESELIASSDPWAAITTTVLEDASRKQLTNTKEVYLGDVKKVDSDVLSKKPSRKEGKKGGGLSGARKLEPLGLGAFGLFVIASLVGLSMGFTTLLFVLIGVSIVVSAISILKIGENKKKWKGRFFGHFVVIVGLLLLALLGLGALIQSIF